MPWYNSNTGKIVSSPSDDNNTNDELVYKPSIYAKEELPTWGEVYEEFYLKKQYNYDSYSSDDNTKIDLYWKIPHKKYLLAIVCNQFNKMIFEDGMKIKIIREINKQLNEDIRDIYFTIYPKQPNFVVSFDKPIIYTIPMPSGEKNPFIIGDNTRVNINDLTSLELNVILCINSEESTIRHASHDEFNKIIEIMIKPFKEYFSGDAVGWKDSNGDIIDRDPCCRNCTGAGHCAK